jgi:hypothetical protein
MDRIAARWASCGAMALTGDPDGDPLAPASAAPTVLDELLAPWGSGAEVLAERAALLGLARGGRRSAGGATRLLRCADGWLAVSLARPEDLELVPAWLGPEVPLLPQDPWPTLAEVLARRPGAEAVEGATLLGLPCASAGERVVVDEIPTAPVRPPDLAGRTVVDLSALWAGPLCAHLLGRAGATVVKVEDPARPDGARRHRRFHDLLNAGKQSVALDLRSATGRTALRRLVRSADVVVTGARRRALEQLGLVPDEVLADPTRPTTWVAVTGHGWDVDRVGFGDDAAVAGGLVAWDSEDGSPRFAADAVADPLTGVTAAVDAVHAVARGVPTFVDRSLAGTAAAFRADGPAVPPEPATVVAEPRVPRPFGAARPLGADTATVLDGLEP